MNFIEEIALYVQKYAPLYDVKVYSPTIAQAILESASGTSELAINAKNITGLKYNSQISELKPYVKIGSEQNADGTYVSSVMQWCSFSSWEKAIEGHFRFLFCRKGVTRYNNLKGIEDKDKYIELIREDGFCTSLNYIKNIKSIIDKYNLIKYDNIKTDDKKYWRVQLGAYKNIENAKRKKNEVGSKGFDCIIKQYGDLYKLQLGAFNSQSNCQQLLNRVKEAGFDAFMTYC